jgi:uracil phosphoribosyltransferase
MPEQAYCGYSYRLPELTHAYGPNVHLLADPVLLTQLARLCKPEVIQPEITQLVRDMYHSLVRMVVAQEFPRQLVHVPTRMYESTPRAVWTGEVLDENVRAVTVNIARAGTLPSQVAFETLTHLLRPNQVRQDHVYMARQTNEQGGVVGVSMSGNKIGGDVDDAFVLVPDPMGATGGSLSNTISLYKSGGSRARKLCSLHLIIAGLSSRFEVIVRGQAIGEFELSMPGVHNVQNALSVIAVADELGVDRAVTRRALKEFGGVQRRFTVRGEQAGITVVDDYAHHPAELRATLSAAQQAYGRRIVAVFQPHRYTRTQLLFNELASSFNAADVLFVSDVYAAGESPIAGADSAHLVQALREHGHRDVTYVPSQEALVSALMPRLQAGDVVLTLGAGSITQLGPQLLAALAQAGVSRGA